MLMDASYVVPGQTVAVTIDIKNGPSALDARMVLFEVESLEEIELPRSVHIPSVMADAAARGPHRPAHPPIFHHAETIFEAKIAVSSGLNLAPGETKHFKGTFRLPPSVQPSFKGKYTKHYWRVRARLDVLGVDPSSSWFSFQVGTAP
jgi:hypothetical protein